MHKQIAKIVDTKLGWEDHGIFTAWLSLDYGGSSMQGAGMYGLSYSPPPERKPVGAPGGIDHIMKILGACGVDSWEKLKGRTVYAIRENDDWGAKVIGLGPLPTESGQDFIFTDVKLWPGLENE
jgi:hypothetical protein